MAVSKVKCLTRNVAGKEQIRACHSHITDQRYLLFAQRRKHWRQLKRKHDTLKYNHEHLYIQNMYSVLHIIQQL